MSSPGISEVLRRKIRSVAEQRCGYCLSRQELVLGVLEIEHIVPLAKGGTDEEGNLFAVEVRRNWVLAGWHPPTD